VPAYFQEVLADNPIFALQLAESSGQFADYGPIGLNGTQNGSLTRQVPTGFPGLPYAVTFGGTTSDYISMGADSRLDLTGDFSYECWVAYTSRATHQMLMGKGWQDASNAGYVIYLVLTTGVVEVERSSLTALGSSSVALANDGKFHHVGVERSGNNYAVYFDGVSVNTFSTSQAIQATTRNFLLGEAFYSASGIIDPFSGSMAAPAVYGHALGSTRWAAHYAARFTPLQLEYTSIPSSIARQFG
jgi:hypothetical protein